MSEHAAEHEPIETAVAQPAIDAAPPQTGLTPDAASVLALQRKVGNRAVNQVLARDPPVPSTLGMRSDTPYNFTSPLTQFAPPGVGSLQVKPLPSIEESAAIRAWLKSNRDSVVSRKKAGSLSMGELIAEIKKAVPAAANALDFQIESLLALELGADAPPAKRGDAPQPVNIPGLQEKLAALFAGGEGEGGKVLVEKNGSYLKVGMLYAEAKYSANKPGTETTAVKVGPGGVELTTEDRGNTTTISAGFGDSFGFKTKTASGVVFDAQISKDDSGTAWNKWSVSVSIPIVGKEVVEARPPIDEIVDAVNKGYGATKGVIGHVAGGGKPTDDAVKQKFKDIKPAIEKLSKAVEARKGPNVTFKFGAEGAPMTVPGGGTVQNTYVGASLVIEF